MRGEGGCTGRRQNQLLIASLLQQLFPCFPSLSAGVVPEVHLAVRIATAAVLCFLPWNPTDNTDEHPEAPRARPGTEQGCGVRAHCRVWFYCWEMPGFVEHSVLPTPVMLESLQAVSPRQCSLSSAPTAQLLPHPLTPSQESRLFSGAPLQFCHF